MLKGSRGSLHNKLGQQLGSRALDAPATARGLVGSAITLPCSCLGLVQRDTGAGGRAWHPSPAVPKAGRLLSEGCGGSRAPSERPWQQARCAVMVKEAFLFPGLSGGFGAASTGYASSSGVFKNIYLDPTLTFF